MAEIKSTIELAMEKAKKFVLSKEERDEMRQKELLQQIRGLSNRLSEGHIPINEVLREIERMDEASKQKAKQTLILQWIDGLSLDENGEGLLKGIESLKERELTEVRHRFHNLLSSYREEADQVKDEMGRQSEEALKRERIYGSAVEPNLEVNQEFKGRLQELNQQYFLKLKEMKERLRDMAAN